MKKRMMWVAAGGALQLLYMAVAARYFYLHLVVGGVIVGLLGILGCGAYMLNTFAGALFLGLDEEVQEIEEDRERVRECGERVKELLTQAEEKERRAEELLAIAERTAGAEQRRGETGDASSTADAVPLLPPEKASRRCRDGGQEGFEDTAAKASLNGGC